MPERFRVVCTMQGAIQAIRFTCFYLFMLSWPSYDFRTEIHSVQFKIDSTDDLLCMLILVSHLSSFHCTTNGPNKGMCCYHFRIISTA